MWDQGSSSLVSDKCTRKSNSLGHIPGDVIASLASQLQKMPLEEANKAKTITKRSKEDHGDIELKLAKLADNSVIIAPSDQNNDQSDIRSLTHAIGEENYRVRSEIQVVKHWVYFSCELLKWEAFDPVSRKWMNLPMINGDTCFAHSDKESMAVGTDLLVLGKKVSGQAVYKYSLLTNLWTEVQPMNEPRCLFGSASRGKIAIFAGGINGNGKILDTVEVYDSEAHAWETLPSLFKPRKMSSGVFMDGKFYVIGGCGGRDMMPLSCGEEYDLVAKKWKVIPHMSPGGGCGTMAPPLLAVVDNELYAADCEAMVVKKYDKKQKVWENIGNLPKNADNVDGWGIAFRGCGERVIIVGGPRTYENPHVEIYSWVPKEGPPQWTVIGRKKSYNFVYNCAIMSC